MKKSLSERVDDKFRKDWLGDSLVGDCLGFAMDWRALLMLVTLWLACVGAVVLTEVL